MRLYRLFTLLSLALVVCPAAATAAPNFIFIMSDDQSPATISAYGTTGANFLAGVVTTPNIDRIAVAGARFTSNITVMSTCSPSRAAVLTGAYYNRTHVTATGVSIDPDLPTVVDALKAAGYVTAIFGKFNLVASPSPGAFDPEALGFDDYDVCTPSESQCQYVNPSMMTNYSHPGSGCPGSGSPGSPQTRTTSGYQTALVTTCAKNWMEAHAADKYAVFIWVKGPHSPFDYEDANAGLAAGTLATPTTFTDDEAGRTDAMQKTHYVTRLLSRFTTWQSWAASGFYHKAVYSGSGTYEDQAAFQYQQEVKDYLRTLRSVDTAVGVILDYLDANPAIKARTMVSYSGDNGYFLGDHGGRNGKGNMYEQSMLVPHLLTYPTGGADAIAAGSVVTALTANVDYAPTILAYAGVAIPATMQGNSMKPLLDGTASPVWRSTVYYDYYSTEGANTTRGVRSATHKLIYYPYSAGNGGGMPEWELIDLVADPNERTNVYADSANADIVTQLNAEMDMWRVRLELETPPPVPVSVPVLPWSGLWLLGILLSLAGAYGISRRAAAQA